MKVQEAVPLALREALVDCGVDRDILESLFNDIFNVTDSSTPIVIAREFTKTAVASQLSWVNSLSSKAGSELEISKMYKGWRPKESALKVVCEILEFDRIEVGYLREFFISNNLGKTHSEWDSLFIYYITSGKAVEEHKRYFENNTQKDDEAIISTVNHENLSVINSVIEEILDSVYVTPYFQYRITERWQPSKWVVKKLMKMNIGKRFIYDDLVILPYISYMKAHARLKTNYDVEYYHWVRERFPKMLKLLTEEKENLEKIIAKKGSQS